MKELTRRIVDISYKERLSHLGSVLSALPLIDGIYRVKEPNEPFVLSSGHAALALYTVLEKNGLGNAEEMFHHHGVHPDRCDSCHLDCSTGSLGQGLPIAVGMALADRNRNVYCLVSDGECAEGSIWESLSVAQEQELGNLMILVNANGWGAYREIDLNGLYKRLKAFCPQIQRLPHPTPDCVAGALLTNEEPDYLKQMCGPTVLFCRTSVEQLPFLKGQDAHYYSMTKYDYEGLAQ